MAKIMKTLTSICYLLSAFLLPAQLLTFDTATTHTNFSQSQSGTYIWITGVATNLPYTAIKTNALSVGDSLATTQGKQNTNNAFLQSEIVANSNSIAALPPLNPLMTSFYTNLWGGASNHLGSVQGVWSYTLTSGTNYATPQLLWSASTIATNTDPATLTVVTNGYTNAMAGYIAIYASPTNGSFGAPYTFTLNTTNTFAGITVSGMTLLGTFTNIVNYSLAFTNRYSPSTLYASGDNTNFWPIYAGYQTTNTTYFALVNGTTNAGGWQSVTIYNASNQPAIGRQNQYHGEDFTVRNLAVEGTLTGTQADQLAANTAAIAAIQAQLAMLTNGITTNIQYVNGTLLALTNYTAHVTNGIIKAVTSP